MKIRNNRQKKQSTFLKKNDQLQFILIVKNFIDIMRNDSLKKYIDMLINLLRIRNKNIINDIHDIIKIKKRFVFDIFKKSNLNFHRFYNISNIIRIIYIVSNIKKMSNVKYINFF